MFLTINSEVIWSLKSPKSCVISAIAVRYNNIKYQGGHMMRNADARTVRSRQETFNSNGGHDA